MKTISLKKAMHITLFCMVVLASVIITKNAIRNIKNLYGQEKATNTAMTCFTDLIY